MAVIVNDRRQGYAAGHSLNAEAPMIEVETVLVEPTNSYLHGSMIMNPGDAPYRVSRTHAQGLVAANCARILDEPAAVPVQVETPAAVPEAPEITSTITRPEPARGRR